jgi:hypothetical protein
MDGQHDAQFARRGSIGTIVSLLLVRNRAVRSCMRLPSSDRHATVENRFMEGGGELKW